MSIGHGADPGFLAVNPQVSHKPRGGCRYHVYFQTPDIRAVSLSRWLIADRTVDFAFLSAVWK